MAVRHDYPGPVSCELLEDPDEILHIPWMKALGRAVHEKKEIFARPFSNEMAGELEALELAS